MQFCEAGGGGLLINKYRGSLTTLLQTVFPEHQWKSYRFSRPHQLAKGDPYFSKTQHLLYQDLKQIFPGIPVVFNHKHSIQGQKAVEFDVSTLTDYIMLRLLVFDIYSISIVSFRIQW